jgi:hypothetical protein
MGGEQMLIPLPGQRKIKTPAVRPAPGGARWTDYTAVHRVKCDDCLAELGRAPSTAPVAAQGRRRLKHDDVDLVLCHRHAHARGDTHTPRRRRV